MNKKKYIPIYHRNNYPNMTELKKTYFPEILDMNNINKDKNEYKQILSLKCLEKFYDYKNFQKKDKSQAFLQPDMREDIKNNAKNLIDRINMNYDLKKWNDFDSRTTFNRFFQPAYSPINNVLKNTDSLKDQFSEILKQKALSLKNVNNKTKKIIERTMNYSDNENEMIRINNTSDENYYNMLLENCATNLLKLKHNNCDSPNYSAEDKKFIEKNKYITKRLNKTNLYKDFPSKTREEFNVKKVKKNKSLYKYSKYNGKIALRHNYGFQKGFTDRLIEKDYLKKMWNRPIHKDAFKIS